MAPLFMVEHILLSIPPLSCSQASEFFASCGDHLLPRCTRSTCVHAKGVPRGIEDGVIGVHGAGGRLCEGSPTSFLGSMSMTPALLDNMVKHGVITKDAARVPPASEAMAHPEADEVMVYMDFFAAGL